MKPSRFTLSQIDTDFNKEQLMEDKGNKEDNNKTIISVLLITIYPVYP